MKNVGTMFKSEPQPSTSNEQTPLIAKQPFVSKSSATKTPATEPVQTATITEIDENDDPVTRDNNNPATSNSAGDEPTTTNTVQNPDEATDVQQNPADAPVN